MKTIQIIFISILLSIFSLHAGAQKTKVLFLGNSYIYTNDLPVIFSKLSQSLGDTISYDQNTPGGYRFLNHASSSTSISKIASQNWDFVILQAQSQEPSWPPSQIETEVFPYAKILVDSIRNNYTCTEPVFLLTWGRKYGDSYNCAAWPPVCSFSGMQERLTAGYMTMAMENNSTIAPAGLAWKHCMDNDTDSLINLYSSDNSHPAFSGSYLTSCVLYATIFRKSPVGSDYYGSLNQSDAMFLQQIAEEVVLKGNYNYYFYDDYTSYEYDLDWHNWFESGNLSYADYTFNQNDLSISIENTSLNATTEVWSIDSLTYSAPIFTHTFTDYGSYLLEMTASNSCNQHLQDTTIIIESPNALESPIKQKMVVYPNPCSDYVHIKSNYEKLVLVEIYNSSGMLIDSQTLSGRNQVDISTLKTGEYIFKVFIRDGNENYQVLQKIIKE
ncbi:MAG: hypothetical protein C0594_02340 [Marinilabiliales bacterium]|mgnify:CR=1 FL=1|nr:MAG: hypothetical protein C0594_02340 [Marinilabiliales bacterium]